MSRTIWSVDEHLDDILASVRPLEPIELQLPDAQGCVLVKDVVVEVALPPFDNSSMDGYAVRIADVEGASEEFPAVLTVIGDVAAGSAGLADDQVVGPGQAARIMTGAPLPAGAEAVVPVEWTDGGTGEGPAAAMRAHSDAPEDATGEVRVHRPVVAGAHVRERGSDVKPGDLALAAGSVVGPPQIGLLAAIGCATVVVRPRPRVVVLSTGSELVQPGEQLTGGQIYDSNSFALTAAARDAGAIAYRVGAVADDAETLRATIEDQLIRADIVVTTGVSVSARTTWSRRRCPPSGTRTSRAAGSSSASSPCSPASRKVSARSARTTPRCWPCRAIRSPVTSPSSCSSAPPSVP